jgi:hypothetical protein
MAVILQSAVRQGPPGCDHYAVTVNVENGLKLITVSMTSAEVEEPLTDEEVQATLKAWAKYRRQVKGNSWAQLLGGVIFRDAL